MVTYFKTKADNDAIYFFGRVKQNYLNHASHLKQKSMGR